MSERETALALARAATASLERSRNRIDDLNVYPVPDGDTGTNLLLTARAVVDALEASTAADRAALVQETTRAALMGARGNSGVILSQIVRGAGEVLGDASDVDAAAVARAFRSASNAAYRAVRRPVEGTMLTVVRELADEAEARAQPRLALDGLLDALVSRGEDAVARTPEQLAVLREAGVVDAGGAGLLEIVRGLASAVAGRPLPEAPLEEEPLTVEAIHQELSRYRYCTTFVVEGAALDVERIESELDPLGDSLLVVGDATALKVHVHTDDPGAALRIGTDTGLIDGVEIANMHRQTEAREERLLELVPEVVNETDVVAVTAGAGNRRLFESLGAAAVVEGGQTMNPAASDLVEAIAATRAPQAVVLPNNPNVVLAANQAGDLAPKPVQVVPTESIQAGLAAMVVFDAAADAATNAARMGEAVAGVATGAVTVASRDVQLNGRAIAEGEYLGLVEGEPVTGGGDFAEVARVIVERLLAEPRDVLTLLKGQDQPALDELLDDLRERHPQLELDVQDGGQPHYPLLLSAE